MNRNSPRAGIATSPRFFAIALALSTVVMPGGFATAELPDEADRYEEHLEFLGYRMSRADDIIVAKHETYVATINLRRQQNGVLMYAFFSLSEEGMEDDNRLDVLEMVNRMSTDALATRFFITRDDTFAVEAWYQGPYDRQRFGQFLDQWHRDTNERVMRQSDDVARFLK